MSRAYSFWQKDKGPHIWPLGSFLLALCVIGPLLLQVGSTDQQPRNLLGACWKCRLSGLAPDPLNLDLHFNRTPGDLCALDSLRNTDLHLFSSQCTGAAHPGEEEVAGSRWVEGRVGRWAPVGTNAVSVQIPHRLPASSSEELPAEIGLPQSRGVPSLEMPKKRLDSHLEGMPRGGLVLQEYMGRGPHRLSNPPTLGQSRCLLPAGCSC